MKKTVCPVFRTFSVLMLGLAVILTMTGTRFVMAADVRPSIDLDPAGSGPDFSATYREADAPVRITSDEAVIMNAETSGLTRLSAVITPLSEAHLIAADTAGLDLVTAYSDGVMNITGLNPGGQAPVASYQAALRTLTYANTSRFPDETVLTIEFTAYAGDAASEKVHTALSLVPVNDPPVHTVPGPQLTPIGFPLTFSPSGGNRLSVTDIDAGTNVIQTTLSVTQGTLRLPEDAEVHASGNDTATLILEDSPENINAALDGLQYIPPDGWYGELTLEIVTDDLGHTGEPGPQNDTDSIPVTVGVQILPDPPVADAGEDQTVTEFNRVTLDGSGSFSEESEIVGWLWTQKETDALPPVSLMNADTAYPEFTAPAADGAGMNLFFELTVTDAEGQTHKDIVTVTVTPSEIPVDVYTEGTTVFLEPPSGLMSADDIRWEQISGRNAPLSSASDLRPGFVAPIVDSAGDRLVFRLTVDQDGVPADFEQIIRIEDNGITGFPDDVLTFSPVSGAVMGIRVSGGSLVRLLPVSPDTIADNAGRPTDLIYGLLDLGVRPLSPGGSSVVTVYLESPAEPGFSWIKHDPVEGWSDFHGYAVFSEDRSRVMITLTDGGSGDSDGTADGMIRDPSGLGRPSDDPPPVEEGGDGSSGGCFISAFGQDG